MMCRAAACEWWSKSTLEKWVSSMANDGQMEEQHHGKTCMCDRAHA
jgi:hypothetical protein